MNKFGRQHPTKQQLYGHLPPITKTIQIRQTRHAGHCWRSRDEIMSDILLRTPSHGRAKAVRPTRIYIQQLCVDTGCSLENLPGGMDDRDEWRERVSEIHDGGAAWWWIYTYIYVDMNIYIHILMNTHTYPHTYNYIQMYICKYIHIYFKIGRSTNWIYLFSSYIRVIYMYVWYKALLMGYSMGLELTLVSSINNPWLVKLVYIGDVVPLSWGVFTLVCFTLLWYLICL